jgi:HAE1 family hydrophobic/amphiphilic exporter-1
MSITELAIKRPSLIVVIFSVLTFLGLVSYINLNYELMPKFSIPVVTVTTVYPGASPSEVENSVTKKIEDALSDLENLDEIKSTSLEGVSSIILALKPNANTNNAMQDAQRKINAMLSSLPDDVMSPSLGKFSFDEMPIVRMGVTAKMSPIELYSIVKDEISPSLAKLKGAAKVTMVGGEERIVSVNINRRQTEAYRISLLQVTQAINNANMEFPTGKITDENSQTIIKLKGKYQSLDDIRNLVISTDRQTGAMIRLKEIATIADAAKEIKTFSRIDGKNSIGLLIQKQNDANAVTLSKQVKAELKKIEAAYAKFDLKFDIASDSSEFTMAAADAVIVDLGLAIFIVALCMLLFLHSLRNSLIVMIAIPASLISVFIAMYLLGYSLNLMTLLAISLVVGILVDDSIVVLENIYRHMEMGKDRITASLEGRAEIGFTALGITLVDVVVFLPITMVGGIISNILSQFSIVVVLSTLMSLFVSFTLTPLLASRLAKVEKINKKTPFGFLLSLFESLISSITNGYAHVLAWSLRHKRYVILGTVGILLASFQLVTRGYVGSEFISQGDRAEFIIGLELPQNATLMQTNNAVLKVEEYLFKNPDVKGVFSSIGTTSAGLGGTLATTNKAEVNVKLVPKEERDLGSDLFAQYAKLELEKILSGVKVTSAAVSIMGNANEAPIELSVTGNSIQENMKTVDAIANKLKSIKGTSEVKLSVESGNPEISVEVDRDKMAEFGLSMEIVGITMQTAFSGNTKAEYSEKGKDYDINIQYDNFNRKSERDLGNLSFINNRGENIKLEQFAAIGRSTGSTKLERKNRVPTVTLTSQLLGVSSGAVVSELTEFIKDANFSPTVAIQFEGSAKNMQESFANLSFALIASILFVYLIMVALYDSYVYPFVVLFSIPVALVGALLALALAMQPLSLFSILGMIMLIGLVAKNAILIVDFTNQLKAEGKNSVEALIESGKARLRPILMTTLAMITGMMPIAFAHGAGAEWKSGLAWVLIGGLTSSMLLTLVVVPCVYLIVDVLKRDIKNKRAKEITREINLDEPVAEHI